MGTERINMIRKKRGMSIEELSRAAGVPVGTVSKITAGITRNPSLDTVKALARALGCKLDDFDDPEMLPPALIAEGEAVEEASCRALLRCYTAMNAEGRGLLARLAEDLAACGRYAPRS